MKIVVDNQKIFYKFTYLFSLLLKTHLVMVSKSISFKLCLLLTVYFAFSYKLNAQDFQNYYQYIDSMDAYYRIHPEYTTEPEGDYLQYLRYKLFWRDRVYGKDTIRKGSPGVWSESMDKFWLEKEHFTPTSVGAIWYQKGPEGLSEQINGLVSAVFVDTLYDKSLNTIYIGTNASGIWKTTNGGLQWANITDHMEFPNLGITQIVGDPLNPGVIYAGTGGHKMERQEIANGYGVGLLKSADHGFTWCQLVKFTPNECHVVYKVIVDPTDSQRLYMLVDSMVLRTANGGVNWDTIFNSLSQYPYPDDRKYLRDIEMHPTNKDILYIASDDCGAIRCTSIAEVWKTENATAVIPHWQRLDTVFLKQVYDTLIRTTERYEIEVSRSDPNAVWVACQDLLTQTGKIWKSYDSGNTWTLKFDHGIDGFDFHRPGFKISSADTGKIYCFGIWAGILKNWKCDTMAIYSGHIDNRSVYLINRSETGLDDTLFVGNDGGISRSTNSGLNYVNINGENLVMTQFWGIGGSFNAPFQVFGGTQDNNLYRLQNNAWNNTGYADYGDVVVAPDSSNIIFASKWNCGDVGAGIVGSMNAGESIKWEINDFMGESATVNQPVVFNPQNSISAMTGVHNLFKLLINGDDLIRQKIEVPDIIDQDEVIKNICIAPSDTNIMYVAFHDPEWEASSTIRKLIRTSDHGVNWTVISEPLNVLRNHSITGIAVNPGNPDSLWISVGGFTYWLTAGKMEKKVFFSPDSGVTWQDISDGLPDVPVNCIKFKQGGSGGLFVGTDVGVFYRDLTDNKWVPFRNQLPQCIVTDLEINDSIGFIRAGTFGRGLWEADISCPYSTDPLIIQDNITWNHDTIMDRSIVIDSMAIFTIKGKVSMPQSSKIYVKPGGKLIIDGGVVTNACLGFWQGIEVWGNPALSPYPPTNQGYVYLINGAVIEHARIGIATCKTDSVGRVLWNSTGGIIVSDEAIFQDNVKSVALLSYPMNQVSNFRRTLFQTTLKDLDGDNPTDFVSLYDVHGVRFLGCTFRNISDSLGHIAGKSKGRGIYSINSQFYVEPYCPSSSQPCPPDEIIPNVFQNLHYGIKQLNYSPTELTFIENARFIDNYRSIFMSGSDYSTITSNEFKIPKFNVPPTNELDTCYGLYLGNCTSYHVENNRFYVDNNVLLQPNQTQRIREIGIIVDNSGGKPNEIYRNRFDSLDLAINAQRVNRDDDEKTGLVIKCNTYHNNSYDEMITRDNENIVEGIAINQGYIEPDSAHTLCGNTFSPYHESVQIAEADIKNTGDVIFYCHHIQGYLNNDPRVQPDFYTSGLVEPQEGAYPYDSLTCCLSNLAQQGSIEEFQLLITIESDKIETLTSNYELLVDGGNTEILHDEIFFSSPEDAIQLHQELLGDSPYLSDTVLKMSVTKEAVLPNTMIRDILVANPQSAKSLELMDQLSDRMQPMPNEMLDEILAGKEFLSPKELLEARMVRHKSTKQSFLNTLIRKCKAVASGSSGSDSLIDMLQNESDLNSKYLLAMEYLKKGDTTQAKSTVSSIPTNYTLSSNQEIQNEDYSKFIDLMCAFRKSNKGIYELTASEKACLTDLMNNSAEPVNVYARNILIANQALDYYEPILFPEATKSSKADHKIPSPFAKKFGYMKIQPNPAQNYLIVDYSIDKGLDAENNMYLLITTSSGKTIEKFQVEKIMDQFVIITTNYLNGSYMCSLFNNGNLIVSEKFIISKN